MLELQPSMIVVPPLTEAAIKSYYQQHQDTFTTEESVRVAYVVLDKQVIRKSLKPTPDILDAFYQSQQHTYTKPPEYQYTLYQVQDGKDRKALTDESEHTIRKHLANSG